VGTGQTWRREAHDWPASSCKGQGGEAIPEAFVISGMVRRNSPQMRNYASRPGKSVASPNSEKAARQISEFRKFRLPTDPNHSTDSPRPVPQRGVGQRHQRGAGCGGRGSARDERGLMRTAKSCGSDAPMLASSLREEAQMTVSNKPGHRGEREVSRKTIARGMPGDFRCDRGDYARVLFYVAREAAGALGARHSLRPLISGRTIFAKPRAHCAARSPSRIWI